MFEYAILERTSRGWNVVRTDGSPNEQSGLPLAMILRDMGKDQWEVVSAVGELRHDEIILKREVHPQQAPAAVLGTPRPRD